MTPELYKTRIMRDIEEDDPYGRPIAQIIRDALRQYGTRRKAAQALGVNTSALYTWMAMLDIEDRQRHHVRLPIAPQTNAPEVQSPTARERVRERLLQALGNTTLLGGDEAIQTIPDTPTDEPRGQLSATDEERLQYILDRGLLTEDEIDDWIVTKMKRNEG